MINSERKNTQGMIPYLYPSLFTLRTSIARLDVSPSRAAHCLDGVLGIRLKSRCAVNTTTGYCHRFLALVLKDGIQNITK